MRCYFLDVHIKSFFSEHRTTASTKPRTDAIRIAHNCGFRSIVLYYWETSLKYIVDKHPLLPNRLLRIQLWFIAHLVRNSIVLVQLPFLRHNMYDVIKKLRKRNKIVILVHDLEAIRATADGTWDLYILQNADALIVHTPKMEQVLREYGVVTSCVSLEFFDYLSPCHREPSLNTENPNIVFAGNLLRCEFLNKLDGINQEERLPLFLYGQHPDWNFPQNVVYKGCFDNEDISLVEGDWGLVWDGKDIDTCSGNLGEYLKYNASFKFSLYLALSIPVIVWSQSALAEYVQKYHLGICVDSLNDIRHKIESLSLTEIEQIKTGVSIFAQKVKTGQMLSAAIEHCMSIVSNESSL